jgi:plasmid stabilization system protein ParE
VNRVRWTPTARRDLRTIAAWLHQNRSAEQAARAIDSIEQAVLRAAESPELYVWVGSIHAALAGLPRTVHRVLTRRPRYAVYYRHVATANEIQILGVRGAGQLSPAPGELVFEEGAP